MLFVLMVNIPADEDKASHGLALFNHRHVHSVAFLDQTSLQQLLVLRVPVAEEDAVVDEVTPLCELFLVISLVCRN